MAVALGDVFPTPHPELTASKIAEPGADGNAVGLEVYTGGALGILGVLVVASNTVDPGGRPVIVTVGALKGGPGFLFFVLSVFWFGKALVRKARRVVRLHDQCFCLF